MKDLIPYMFFDMQLQNILSQYLWLNCNDKGINTNNKSDIFIKSFHDTICILKKELINKENAIKNLYIYNLKKH